MKTAFAFLLSLWAVFALAQDTPPKVQLKLDKPSAAAGSVVKGTVIVTFEKGLHGYQNPPSDPSMIPIEVVAGDKTTKILKVEYPKGVDLAGSSEPVKVYEGTIKIPVQLKAPDKTGKATLKIKLNYQQCTETNCFAPSSVTASATLDVTKKNREETAETGSEPVEDPATPTLASNTTPGTSPAAAPEDDSFVARLIRDGFAKKNYGWVLLACLLTGLALALTPCVYPMIPITVSFFSGQSAGSRAGRIGLGVMYMLGIAITYGAVGGIAASLGGAVGELFKKPWFLFGLAAFMAFLALSMFDVYQIGIPGPIAKHLKGRSGAVGALVMGLLVGFAAAPCAGALVAAFAVEVAKIGQVAAGLLVFTTIGIGLGLPFVVIGAMSTGAKALPKSGGWLKAVKAVLGIVVFWIAADYLFKGLGFKPEEARTAIAWAIFFALSAGYLFLFENSGSTRLIFGIKGAAILVLGVLAGQSLQSYGQIVKEEKLAALVQKTGGQGAAIPTRINWIKYTPEAFEEAKATGKPILIDGTADWCLACKEIEHAVFDKPEAIVALRNVVTMKIDLSTGVDPAYDEMVRKQFNIVGLPHIMLMKPGGEQARLFQDIKQLPNPKVLIEALKEVGAEL